MRLRTVRLTLLPLCTACGSDPDDANEAGGAIRYDGGEIDSGEVDSGEVDSGEVDSGILGVGSVTAAAMPLPAGATAARPISLSDEGHVLLYATVGGSPRYFLWSGDADEEPSPIVLPDGYTLHSMGCIANGDVIALVAAFPEDALNERRYATLSDGVVEEIGDVSDAFGLPNFVACTNEGTFVAASIDATYLMRSGASTVTVGGGGAPFYGINGHDDVGTPNGVWRDGDLIELPTEEGFRFYAGPSDDGLALGSFDELSTVETAAAIWDIESNEVTVLPLHPVTRQILGPMAIGRKSDLVVGTDVSSPVGNTVYLRRNDSYALLGTTGEDFTQFVDINAAGQVLVEACSPISA